MSVIIVERGDITVELFTLRNFGYKHEEKKKVENVFVTFEVSERSPDNTKHVQLNQPVNSTSVNFEHVLITCGEKELFQTATVPIQTAKLMDQQQF